MKQTLTPEQLAAHEAAWVDRIRDELCDDIAERCAKGCKRIVDRPMAQLRYKQIARMLYCLRPKPRSKRQRLVIQATWDRAVDCISDARREEGWEKYAQAMIARDHWKTADGEPITTAKRLVTKWTEQGKRKSLSRLKAIITRYLLAKEMGQNWAKKLPLLHLLALEYLRDERLLWQFIEAAIKRWKTAGGDTHRRSVVLHQTAAAHCHDWQKLAAYLKSIKAAAPNERALFNIGLVNTLKSMSADECKKAMMPKAVLSRSRSGYRPSRSDCSQAGQP